MKIEFISGLIVGLVLLASLASACLTNEQKDVVIALATKNNMSASGLVGVFESVCSYSENRTEVIVTNKLNNFQDNYSDWIREQTNITQVLFLIADLVNASNRVNEIYSTVDGKLDSYEQKWNTKIAKSDDDLNEKLVNITEQIRGLQLQPQPQPQQDNSLFYIVIIIIVVAGVSWLYYGKKKATVIQRPQQYEQGRRVGVHEYREEAQDRFAKAQSGADKTDNGGVQKDKRKGRGDKH